MRSKILIILTLFCMPLFTSCAGKLSEEITSPEKLVLTLFNAMDQKDVETLKNIIYFSSDADRIQYEKELKREFSREFESNLRYVVIVNSTIKKNKAVVNAVFGDSRLGKTRITSIDYYLMKKGKEWKMDGDRYKDFKIRWVHSEGGLPSKYDEMERYYNPELSDEFSLYIIFESVKKTTPFGTPKKASDEIFIDISTKPIDEYIILGEVFRFKVDVVVFGHTGKSDLIFNYKIVDIKTRRSFINLQETMPIDQKASLIKEIQIPSNIPPGEYLVRTTASLGDLSAKSSFISSVKIELESYSCSDGIKNQDESDVDCGGVCQPCADGMRCRMNSDCMSNRCVMAICTT